MEKAENRLRSAVITKIMLSAFLIVAFHASVLAESESIDLTFKTTTVFTPRGTPVDARIYSESIASAEMSRINERWAATVQSQGAEILSDATYTYNCHGYTWYMSEGGNGRLYIENPQPYLTDGSYAEIKASEVAKGDKVLYGDGVHSGVIADEPEWVISKWSDGPLVKHRLRDVPPEFGSTFELTFYRKVPYIAPPPNLRIIKVEE